MLSVGQGTTFYPYIYFLNGPLIATSILAFAGLVSVLASFWLIKAADATEAKRYEDMALKTYGRKCATFTSVMMLMTMLGFVIAMMVLVSSNPLTFQFKSVFPCALDAVFLGPLPTWIANTPEGQKFWCTIFAFAILMPMSFARNLSALRLATILSFVCVCFVIITLVMECLLNRQVNPELD